MEPKFQLDDRVKIVRMPAYPHYVGLKGKIVWIANTGERYQVQTDTKPRWSRQSPPYMVTVEPDWIEHE